MKYKKQAVIMSHLSDCQEMINFHNHKEQLRQRINFVKMILMDSREEFTSEELDQIWKRTNKEFGQGEEMSRTLIYMDMSDNIRIERNTVVKDEDDFNSTQIHHQCEFIGIAKSTEEIVEIVNTFGIGTRS